MRSRNWKTGIGIAVGACLVTVATVWLVQISKIDPFAALRGSKPIGPDFPIHISDASMKSWHGKDLVSTANVGSMDVRSDLRYLKFADVTQGDYNTGKHYFHYKAGAGNLDFNAETCYGIGPVEVSGQHFDLISHQFSYSLKTKNLAVPGYTEGALYGGYLKATGVYYSLETGNMSTGPIQWDGNLNEKNGFGDLVAQAKPDDEKPTPWHFDAPGGVSISKLGKDTIWTYLNCTGTDGTVIVKAPKVIYDQTIDVVKCYGSVLYYSPKVNLTCDTATIYRQRKVANLEGHVVFYVKPKDQETVDPNMPMPKFDPLKPGDVSPSKSPAPMVEEVEASPTAPKLNNSKLGTKDAPSAKANVSKHASPPAQKLTPEEQQKMNDELRSNSTIRKYPSVVFAEKIIYYYQKGSRHADIEGSPQAQQEFPHGMWRRIWADSAYYDGEADTLKMNGFKEDSVIFKDSLGDSGMTNWAIVSTIEGDETFSAGPMKGYALPDNPDLKEAAKEADQKDKLPPNKSKKPGSTKKSP